jgi:hypothetical protein
MCAESADSEVGARLTDTKENGHPDLAVKTRPSAPLRRQSSVMVSFSSAV